MTNWMRLTYAAFKFGAAPIALGLTFGMSVLVGWPLPFSDDLPNNLSKTLVVGIAFVTALLGVWRILYLVRHKERLQQIAEFNKASNSGWKVITFGIGSFVVAVALVATTFVNENSYFGTVVVVWFFANLIFANAVQFPVDPRKVSSSGNPRTSSLT